LLFFLLLYYCMLDAHSRDTGSNGDHGDAAVVLMLALFVCGAVWLAKDVPSILRDLWQILSELAAQHEASQVVDCRPWGFDRTFVIAQDLARTAPVHAPICTWAPAPGRKYDYGLSLWNASQALSQRFCEDRCQLTAGAFCKGNTVVELGCGQALVSMVVSALFPDLRRVVATDGSENVLLSAESNIAANIGAACGVKLELEVLNWGCRDQADHVLAINNGAAYDVVLGADVTYVEDCRCLVETAAWLSHGKTEFWLAHEVRKRSSEQLEASLRLHFLIVEPFSMQLAAQQVSRHEDVAILGWRCIGSKLRETSADRT